jgi:large subunit ribosomal protein L35
MKTHKSIAKRFRKTKSGKILHRKCGRDHFNTKESGKITRNKRRDKRVAKADMKIISSLIN